MMPKAEEILKQYRAFPDSLTKTQVSLRFNLPWVKVSDIAGQYYCEKAVELDYEQVGEKQFLPKTQASAMDATAKTHVPYHVHRAGDTRRK